MKHDDLRYPIGPFQSPGAPYEANLPGWIANIARLPADLREAVAALAPGEVERPYRPGGWTSRQVVHHLADSHTHSYYLRCKWALTEDPHHVRPYDERRFMELGDSAHMPSELNLDYIAALHGRFAIMLENAEEAAFRSRIIHPELGDMPLGEHIGRVAWHGRHHLAHVRLVAATAIPSAG